VPLLKQPVNKLDDRRKKEKMKSSFLIQVRNMF